MARDRRPSQGCTEEAGRDLLLVQELLGNGVVESGQDVDESGARRYGLLREVGRDIDGRVRLAAGGALFFPPDKRLHLEQVDHSDETALDTDRELYYRDGRSQAVLDHVDAPGEVRPDPVHLVDEADARDLVLVGLAPDSLGLGLDTGYRVKDGDRPVEDAQRPLDLDGEVDVAGGVDDVDAVISPLARSRRRGDRDTTLLFLGHPVHRGAALMDFAHLVVDARVVQDPLGSRGLARVNVGHDPDVAGPGEGELSFVGGVSHSCLEIW